MAVLRHRRSVSVRTIKRFDFIWENQSLFSSRKEYKALHRRRKRPRGRRTVVAIRKPRESPAYFASLATRLVSRETFRAPVFLCRTPLETPRMISGSAAFSAV